MRGFDFLILMFSVLLGLSLARLLVGLARVVVDRERPIHWLPLLWTVQLLLFQITLWWLVYQRADQPTRFFAYYLVLVAYPVLLYFLGVLLYPDPGCGRERAGGGNMRSTRCIPGVALLVSGAAFGVAIWTRNRIYHAVLAAALLIMLTVSVIRLLPTIR